MNIKITLLLFGMAWASLTSAQEDSLAPLTRMIKYISPEDAEFYQRVMPSMGDLGPYSIEPTDMVFYDHSTGYSYNIYRVIPKDTNATPFYASDREPGQQPSNASEATIADVFEKDIFGNSRIRTVIKQFKKARSPLRAGFFVAPQSIARETLAHAECCANGHGNFLVDFTCIVLTIVSAFNGTL